MNRGEVNSVNPFSKPILLIITGANRGYGYALAETALHKLKGGSAIIISGRNQRQLDEVRTQLLTKSLSKIDILSFEADLSVEKEFSSFMENALKDLDITKFAKFMLLNNAGSLGDVTQKIHQYNDPAAIVKYMNLNISSVMFLSSKFVDKFASEDGKCFLINISSLCAIQPFASMAQYCVGKAARDMMFKVLALERKDVRVINWAPGPMPTTMLQSLMHCGDEGNAAMFKKMITEKTFVECMDSATKLFSVLEKNQFVSGDHIDYFDV